MAIINDFVSLVYPRACEACGVTLYRHEYHICTRCKVTLPKSGFHLREENELSYVFAGRVSVVTAGTLYIYEKRGRVQRLLHAIKYHRQKELAEYLGRLYAKDLTNSGGMRNADVVVPIPLHRKKLSARGFNQSEWFAKGIAGGLNLPVDTQSLVRTVETATQTRKKKFQRWENVKGIFSVTNPAAFENKHVLIVDDVITTGATIEAAWTAIREVKGARISVAGIAFASRI